MANFFGQDDVQDLTRAMVAHADQLVFHPRRGVQATGLHGAGHDANARQHIGLRALGHVPQSVVGGEITVVKSHAHQVVAQQGEMLCFLLRDAHPVGVKSIRQAGKAPDSVQRQINRVELDVGDRVHQHGAAFQGGHRLGLELCMGHQHGLGPSAGASARGCEWRFCAHRQLQVQRQSGLGLQHRIGFGPGNQGRSAQSRHGIRIMAHDRA